MRPLFNFIYIIMNENFRVATYKARVVEVCGKENCVEIAFIYYGSRLKNVHTDEIKQSSRRYEKALKVRVGDEVYAAPMNYDKIYHFSLNGWLKRGYVRLKGLW